MLSVKWKLATFNVNGVRSREQVLVSWLERNRPDVLCLQEIKCREAEFPFDSLREAGYQASVCGQKSFNGVAILSARKPEQVRRGFGDGGWRTEARLIAAKIDGIWIFNTYVPQGRSPDHPAFQHQTGFFRQAQKPFRIDNSCLPTQLSGQGTSMLRRRKLTFFRQEEWTGKSGFILWKGRRLPNVVSWGFIDLFRKHHPDVRQFTFWDYRLPQSFNRDLGWRLDHIRATEPVAKASIDCLVDADLRGQSNPSDHTPVWAEIELQIHL